MCYKNLMGIKLPHGSSNDKHKYKMKKSHTTPKYSGELKIVVERGKSLLIDKD